MTRKTRLQIKKQLLFEFAFLFEADSPCHNTRKFFDVVAWCLILFWASYVPCRSCLRANTSVASAKQTRVISQASLLHRGTWSSSVVLGSLHLTTLTSWLSGKDFSASLSPTTPAELKARLSISGCVCVFVCLLAFFNQPPRYGLFSSILFPQRQATNYKYINYITIFFISTETFTHIQQSFLL